MANDVSYTENVWSKKDRDFIADVMKGHALDTAIRANKVPAERAFWILAQTETASALHDAQSALLRIAANDAIRRLRVILKRTPKSDADRRLQVDAAKTILDRAGHAAGQPHRAIEEGQQSQADASLEDLERQLQAAKAKAADVAKTIDVPADNAQNNAQQPSQDTDIFD